MRRRHPQACGARFGDRRGAAVCSTPSVHGLSVAWPTPTGLGSPTVAITPRNASPPRERRRRPYSGVQWWRPARDHPRRRRYPARTASTRDHPAVTAPRRREGQEPPGASSPLNCGSPTLEVATMQGNRQSILNLVSRNCRRLTRRCCQPACGRSPPRL